MSADRCPASPISANRAGRARHDADASKLLIGVDTPDDGGATDRKVILRWAAVTLAALGIGVAVWQVVDNAVGGVVSAVVVLALAFRIVGSRGAPEMAEHQTAFGKILVNEEEADDPQHLAP